MVAKPNAPWNTYTLPGSKFNIPWTRRAAYNHTSLDTGLASPRLSYHLHTSCSYRVSRSFAVLKFYLNGPLYTWNSLSEGSNAWKVTPLFRCAVVCYCCFLLSQPGSLGKTRLPQISESPERKNMAFPPPNELVGRPGVTLSSCERAGNPPLPASPPFFAFLIAVAAPFLPSPPLRRTNVGDSGRPPPPPYTR